MQIRKTPVLGLIEIVPNVYHDDRGYFLEAYHLEKFQEAGIAQSFVQINRSFSKKGVVRGLHFQRAPHQQGKLVSVSTGKVLDVALDLREGSPTFGQYERVLIDSEQQNMLFVPEGFAHGFVALEDTIFSYQCTNLYHQPSDGGIRWNDAELAIDWELERYGIHEPIVSEKDQKLPTFADYLQQHAPSQ